MTRRAKILLLFGIIFSAIGLLIIAKFLFFSKKEISALQINSFPKADVYLNDKKEGVTPFSREGLAPGEYTVKITTANLSWTGKVKLTSGAITSVNRELGETPDSVAGEILSLEKISPGSNGEVAAISDPTGAIVKIDGKVSGTTPTILTNLSSSDHEIALSFPGYRDRFIRANVLSGYRLNISSQLAKTGEIPTTLEKVSTPSAKTQETTPIVTTNTKTTEQNSPEKPYVRVKQTPTGWLRVRVEPTTTATEAAKINPGEKYPLTDEKTGWVKIRYKELLEGWVSETYVEKFQ